MHGYDAARAMAEARTRVLTIEAHDPTLAMVVHDIRFYAPQDIRFGVRYANIVSTAPDGMLVADLGRVGALEPGVIDHQEEGWTEREQSE